MHFRHRLLFYFCAAAALTIAATIAGEMVLVARVVDHSRRGDLRLATGVAHHVTTALAAEYWELLSLLAKVPVEKGPVAVRSHLKDEVRSMFEPGGLAIFTEDSWAIGAERAPGGLPPQQLLLPALREARKHGTLQVTSMWRGTDGHPRVSLVGVLDGGQARWRAAVGNIRVDQTPFLSTFGFFLSDPDVRLQIVDAAGIALFSTVSEERYRSVVHGTYLLDRARQSESVQVRCHACHEGAGGDATREEELSTLAPVPGTAWSVLVRENPAQMRQVLTELTLTMVALVCLILGAFTGFYWLLASRVVRPLRQLAQAAAAVTAATPSHQPPPAAKDEMQLLADSFEAMLAQVKAGEGSEPSSKVPQGPLTLAEPAPAALDPRENLQRTLATAVEGFRHVEPVSAILVVVRGEAIGEPPVVVGTCGERTAGLAAVLRALAADRDQITAEELVRLGAEWALFDGLDSFHRSGLDALQVLQGDVWVATADRGAVKALKPISILIKLHLQGILDRSLLSENLWHAYRQKSRMLGHLFGAEAAERKRIAQEIHDDTAQALTALLLVLETFPVGGDGRAQERAVRLLQERVGGIIDSTDRIMKRLRPALLDDLGLVEAIRVMGEDVLDAVGIDFELEAPDEELRATPEIEDAVFRVFQEAASNVVRHAGAKRVSARLEVVGAQLRGSFEDDGRGMLEPKGESFSDRPRFGLLGMRERVTQLGGTIRLSSSSTGGLRIEISVPWRGSERPRLAAAGGLR